MVVVFVQFTTRAGAICRYLARPRPGAMVRDARSKRPAPRLRPHPGGGAQHPLEGWPRADAPCRAAQNGATFAPSAGHRAINAPPRKGGDTCAILLYSEPSWPWAPPPRSREVATALMRRPPIPIPRPILITSTADGPR